MAHFLYISDVFCPWCYGFAPVMRRLTAEHPDLPVRVLSGDLVEEPTTVEAMIREHPTMRAFFDRLSRTTGQSVGGNFLRRLDPGQGDLRMFSPDMAAPLAALKKAAPGRELEQMEAFQTAFYGEGRDVLSPARKLAPHEIALFVEGEHVAPLAEQRDLVRRELAGGEGFERLLNDPDVLASAEREREEAVAIMGDFVVYPTLFLETDDGGRHLLARGYTHYDTAAARLAAALGGGATEPAAASADACGLDGACPL